LKGTYGSPLTPPLIKINIYTIPQKTIKTGGGKGEPVVPPTSYVLTYTNNHCPILLCYLERLSAAIYCIGPDKVVAFFFR